jgi:hypothetical protein
VDCVVQEADVRAGLAGGGEIESVVVLATKSPDGETDYVPYLLPSWRRGFVVLGLFRGPGLRGYRDLDRLVRFLRTEFRYGGIIQLALEDDPKLSKHRSLSAARAAASPDNAVQREEARTQSRAAFRSRGKRDTIARIAELERQVASLLRDRGAKGKVDGSGD